MEGVKMQIGKITKIKMPSLKSFDFQIKYNVTDRRSHTFEIGLHTHNELEIYINLSGDVSFLVENNLYDLSRGDVIVARPGEHHHCVYRSDAPHAFYWLLFDCEENRAILDLLQEDLTENYFSPPNGLREELTELCRSLHGGNQTEEEKIYAFFRLLEVLKRSRASLLKPQSVLSQEMSGIVDYINTHVCEEISVRNIAKLFFTSQSSLERNFKAALNMTPAEYIRRKRLIIAAEMLQKGESVINAGASVCYSDTSYFIELFKRYYHMTPLQYKKKYKA